MALKREQAAGIGLAELLLLETSVLRTLCLTINASGSEIKSRILDTLKDADFYFPITKGIFTTLVEMQRRGDSVDYINLEEELRRRSIHMPEHFFLEDLFRGEIPALAELNQWLARLTGREDLAESSAPATIAEKLATAFLGRETPSPAPTVADTARPSDAPVADASAPSRPGIVTPLRPGAEMRRTVAELERHSKARRARPQAVEAKPRQAMGPILSSEGEEWASYLQELAAKQGRRLETGFAGLDESVGGLIPGLMLIVDQNPDRLSGFLKQLTDQLAARSKVPCLYLSFKLPKAMLRLRTIARLAGVPARDIERGRLKKGSPEWESVEQTGQKAAEWLKQVFVVEAGSEMRVDLIRDMGRQLLESGGRSSCLMVVDALGRMDKESTQAIVAQLKGLAQSLDALVIAGTATRSLAADPAVDFLGVFSEGQGSSVQLELLRTGDARSTILRFEYQPEIHRFTEQPGS
jgi:hypothetical protein